MYATQPPLIAVCELQMYLFVSFQVKQAEKEAMIEGIRQNGTEAADFVIRKVNI